MNYGDVKKTVQAILGDPDGDWVTDGYIKPIVNHVYRLQILYLSETCSPYITKQVVLPNLPIGTTDLSKWQNDKDQPFFGLFNVFQNSIYWKMAGAPVSQFRQAKQYDVLPDVDPASQNPPYAGMGWEWRAWVVYLTPLNYEIDIRIRGEFIPAPLLDEDTEIAVHPLLGDVLAEDSAACASRERANPGQMQAYQLTGTQGLDNIANQLVRSQQGTTVRVGRASRGGMGRWPGWGPWAGGQ